MGRDKRKTGTSTLGLMALAAGLASTGFGGEDPRGAALRIPDIELPDLFPRPPIELPPGLRDRLREKVEAAMGKGKGSAKGD